MRWLAVLAAALAVDCAFSQTYPARPVRLVLAYAAGGAMDMSARVIAPLLQESMGQPVIVENRTASACCRIRRPSKESGARGFETVLWWGPAVAAGTPAPIVKRLYDEFAKAMRNPLLSERCNAAGLEVTPSASPEAFSASIKAEIERWAPVVKSTGAKVDN